MPGSRSNYVTEHTREQADKLFALLVKRGWSLDVIPYTRWRAKQGRTSVISYLSGKLMVQGPDTADFVQFILEPEILGRAEFGYEAEQAELQDPAMFELHAGIDESGKGDFLGSLCVACCCTDQSSAKILLKAGVADSKTIKSDAKIKELDRLIRKTCQGKFSLVVLKPETYNRLYQSFGNLNRLLAWGHAKALENVLEMVPECKRAIDDQFAASKTTVERALMERGRTIQLDQHPRAEADIAVAAASILARAEFVRQMEWLAKEAGLPSLPKGGSAAATEAARKIQQTLGNAQLPLFAKMHFKNALNL